MKLFTEHPATAGESYFEHMGSAMSFAAAMFTASIACFLHAFLPFLFKTRGKDTISDLYVRMVTHRHKDAIPPEGSLRAGQR
jgi:hypothetical protein